MATEQRYTPGQVRDDEDMRLIARIRAKDIAAFETLYRGYHVRLSRFLLRLVNRPTLVEEVLNVLWRLCAETDMTMLLVTHEMGFAHDFADRVLFFDRGKIVEEGKPDEIFRHPKQERTQCFLKKIIAAGHRV